MSNRGSIVDERLMLGYPIIVLNKFKGDKKMDYKAFLRATDDINLTQDQINGLCPRGRYEEIKSPCQLFNCYKCPKSASGQIQAEAA